MNFLRKLIAVIGRGPTAVATAGIIGTSVSAPKIIDSVGPSCLPVADRVRALVTKRWETGNIKNADPEGIWADALDISEGDMATVKSRYPCYLFMSLYGGVLYNTRIEDEQQGKNLNVTRECLNGVWEKVWKGVKEGWEKVRSEIGEKTQEVKEILKIIETAKEGGFKKIFSVMKEVNESWKKVNTSNTQVENDLYKKVDEIFYNSENAIVKKIYKQVGDDFERKVLKIVEIGGGVQKISEDKLIKKLTKNPTLCAAT